MIMSTSAATSFPVGAAVIIQDLVSAAAYNGSKGTVLSALDPSSLRQHVFLKASNKMLAIKPVNLKLDTESSGQHEDGPFTAEQLRQIHQNLGSGDTKKSPAPGWYHKMVDPNGGNQYLVNYGTNGRRKPSAERLILGIDSDLYWQGGGKYQDLFDELVNTLPARGPAPTQAGEIIRSANRLMYDLWNNDMMNNTSSALYYLARKGVFPTAGGDKVYATIYPYSLGPMGNTPYTRNKCSKKRDDLTKAIETMIDRSCKFILKNPHLKAEVNTEDSYIGPDLLKAMVENPMPKPTNVELDGSEKVTKANAQDDPEDWKGLMQTLQLAMEAEDNGGCTHGRPSLTLLGEDGFRFIALCEDPWDDMEPSIMFLKMLASPMTRVKYSDLFKDTARMKLVLTYLKASAATCYLGGNVDKAAGIVGCIMIFEDLTAFPEDSLRELLTNDDRESYVATFLSANIPCSCLDQSNSRELCHSCNKANRSKLLLQCSVCFSVWYCSKECQRDDWKNHKKYCRRQTRRKMKSHR